MNNILLAFLLTLLAGLATGIGSCIAFFAKKTNKKFLCISLGFSAGVMIYVSMIEIFQEAKNSLIGAMGLKAGSLVTVISFFVGIAIIALIDKFVPEEENPHEARSIEDIEKGNVASNLIYEDSKNESFKDKALMRTGLVTALAIAIHNIPEGLATFVSALNGASLAIPITIAIAIHNIPEGISVSVPIYYATGDKKKAFLYSFLSGMSEPVGAIIGYTLLRNIFNDMTLGILLAAVAGIMVFISLDELLPTARKYGEHHLSIYGLIAGMVVMAVSLLLFI
ncbi:zinc transporter ZupT [Clostridium perfringens]|nr:zinc transporter ZupT [Clostridium perfringens]